LKIERLIYDTLPFREKFKMKSEDTLDWYPAQLPPVKIILGEAVLAVGKQGRPINTRTLLEYLLVRLRTTKCHLLKMQKCLTESPT